MVQLPGNVSGLIGLDAAPGAYKAHISCYLQSASLVNKILPPLRGAPPVHTRSYTLSAHWILNRLVLRGCNGEIENLGRRTCLKKGVHISCLPT